MLLVLLIVGVWTAGLLVVAGLCATARRGDVDVALAAEGVKEEAAVTAMPARSREPLHAAARIAA